MIFSRGALYFDEVARRGSIRRAAEHLHIVPSAVDRQILQLEQYFGVPLFERRQQGMKLTTAGEILIDAVRRWRRDLKRVESHVDDLQGLRRGEVSIALVEGSAEFLTKSVSTFNARYPAIAYRMHIAGAQTIVDLVSSGEFELGLTFNPPKSNALRIERKLSYQLGIVVRADHPLAGRRSISLAECSKFPMVVPDESISLRRVVDEVWAKHIGGELQYSVVASSIGLMKSLIKNGVGIGMLTALDAYAEIHSGELAFVPLSEHKIPLSTLCIVSASGRTLSVPTSLLIRHLSQHLTAAAP